MPKIRIALDMWAQPEKVKAIRSAIAKHFPNHTVTVVRGVEDHRVIRGADQAVVADVARAVDEWELVRYWVEYCPLPWAMMPGDDDYQGRDAVRSWLKSTSPATFAEIWQTMPASNWMLQLAGLYAVVDDRWMRRFLCKVLREMPAGFGSLWALVPSYVHKAVEMFEQFEAGTVSTDELAAFSHAYRDHREAWPNQDWGRIANLLTGGSDWVNLPNLPAAVAEGAADILWCAGGCGDRASIRTDVQAAVAWQCARLREMIPAEQVATAIKAYVSKKQESEF